MNPNQGTIPAAGNVQVAVSYVTSTSLAANSYQGTLAIIVPNAANPQINVPVNLVVSNQPLLTLPGATRRVHLPGGRERSGGAERARHHHGGGGECRLPASR